MQPSLVPHGGVRYRREATRTGTLGRVARRVACYDCKEEGRRLRFNGLLSTVQYAAASAQRQRLSQRWDGTHERLGRAADRRAVLGLPYDRGEALLQMRCADGIWIPQAGESTARAACAVGLSAYDGTTQCIDISYAGRARFCFAGASSAQAQSPPPAASTSLLPLTARASTPETKPNPHWHCLGAGWGRAACAHTRARPHAHSHSQSPTPSSARAHS
jgi:hypothetical protein